ncbi:MAG: hypothetical protein GTN69_10570 [Armatimonadetes bacterium]|nr:hypothetical protein [Armatimonadota bacterium]
MARRKNRDAERFTRVLPVALTDEEIQARGLELAAKMNELDKIDLTVQAAKDKAKEDRKPIDKRIAELRRQLTAKAEDRQVQCEEVKDYGTKRAQTVRLDTAEVIDDRPLTSDELQGELHLLPGQGHASMEA